MLVRYFQPRECQTDSNIDSCSSRECTFSYFDGVCGVRLPNQGKQIVFQIAECGCCPDNDQLACDDCGGDAGSGSCAGTGDSGIQYQGCKCSSGNDDPDLPPVIVPIIPPGWLPVPPGVPGPKEECLTSLPACSDCDGFQGWCREGSATGCPCTEECTEGDDAPKCDNDETCAGKDGECTIGPQQGCKCQEDVQCPDPEETYLVCGNCGGPSDEGNCKGVCIPILLNNTESLRPSTDLSARLQVEDENNKWQGCDCIDDSNGVAHPYEPYASEDDYLSALKALHNVPEFKEISDDIGCQNDSAPGVPSALRLEDQDVDPNGLLFRLRQGK
jgi:hypothetical protein